MLERTDSVLNAQPAVSNIGFKHCSNIDFYNKSIESQFYNYNNQ